MTVEEQLRWVQPPLQDRSQKTMERLLSAAQARITEVGFEKATIAEIAKRADSSVGAFYSRFSDKEALLRCLLDRFVFEAKATIDAAMRPELWEGKSVRELCSSLLAFLSRVLDDRRLFIVALSKAAMDNPTLADFRTALGTHTAKQLGRLIEARGLSVRGDDLTRTMRVVAWVCLAALETGCVHTKADLGGVPRDEFNAELATMIVAYLGLEMDQSL